MAFEGLLTKLGPTLVREATPHLMQLITGMGERFRKDTGDIKATVDAELASVAQTHAGLVTSLGEQRDRLDAIENQIATADRRVELLHKAVDSLARQLAREAADSAKAQRATRNMALIAAISSVLALAGAVTTFILHR